MFDRLSMMPAGYGEIRDAQSGDVVLGGCPVGDDDSPITYSPIRCFSFFFAFFAAFFSLGVIAGTFLLSLLLFCSLPMVLAFVLN